MAELSPLALALVHSDEDAAMSIVEEQLASGVSAQKILDECSSGMIELGERFAREEAFLPDLMFGGMVLKNVTTKLEPFLSGDSSDDANAVQKPVAIIGTVQHDIHDIGKDIVIMMLRGIGFEVVDLGVDVAPQKFVKAIETHKPTIVGMSLLLTTSYKSVEATVRALKEAGVRDQVKLAVGGAAASPMLAETYGIDFYGKTAVDTMRYACEVVGI
ncbi:MAG: cobalamin-dependent protein [Thermoguttaceae bacterium]|nr:cobalamin-dependent protein [Thermoguttaceae bacterium]